MAGPARTAPPFTRLNHPDPATNRVVQDIYDKLNAVTQAQAAPAPASPASPAPPPANLRRITTSYTLAGADHTVSANVGSNTSVLLPPTETVQGRGPFVIHNETGSRASLSLGSARSELVGVVPATDHILAPGESLSVQPHPGYWIAIGVPAGASALSPTTAATPSVPAVPLTPSGVPPPGSATDAPVVTSLPVPPDPLAVVGQYVTFNGQQYIFTAPLTGAGDGYWSRSAVNFVTIRDTMANLVLYNAADYAPGSLFTATDWLVSYAVQVPSPTNVPTWVYYNGVYSDVIANLPGALGVNDKNFQFHATDYFHNWIWNGTAWHLGTGGNPPGFLAFFISPAYLPPGSLWHLCDGSTQNISQDDGTLVATVLPTVANQYIVQ